MGRLGSCRRQSLGSQWALGGMGRGGPIPSFLWKESLRECGAAAATAQATLASVFLPAKFVDAYAET